MHPLHDLLDQAIELSSQGRQKEALTLYKQIIAQDDTWDTPYYNAGLLYKYKLDWPNSLQYNLRATELDPTNEAAWWNLGIAATALNQWKLARTCWNRCGMKYEECEEDPYGNVGASPIRLNPEHDGEVVWSTRVDPARAIIDNIPFPSSQHCYGDLVLNDGAAVGARMHDGQEYPVFNELQLLKRSKYQTFSLKCTLPNLEVYKQLTNACKVQDIAIENWTYETYSLCKQCSEGTPHELHDKERESENNEVTIAFASQSEEALSAIIDDWIEQTGIEISEYTFY